LTRTEGGKRKKRQTIEHSKHTKAAAQQQQPALAQRNTQPISPGMSMLRERAAQAGPLPPNPRAKTDGAALPPRGHGARTRLGQLAVRLERARLVGHVPAPASVSKRQQATPQTEATSSRGRT
jgi:hypothetical protein